MENHTGYSDIGYADEANTLRAVHGEFAVLRPTVPIRVSSGGNSAFRSVDRIMADGN